MIGLSVNDFDYVNKYTGILYTGLELTTEQRINGAYQKIRKYQKNKPYWNGKTKYGQMIFVRKIFGQEIFECLIEKRGKSGYYDYLWSPWNREDNTIAKHRRERVNKNTSK